MDDEEIDDADVERDADADGADISAVDDAIEGRARVEEEDASEIRFNRLKENFGGSSESEVDVESASSISTQSLSRSSSSSSSSTDIFSDSPSSSSSTREMGISSNAISGSILINSGCN